MTVVKQVPVKNCSANAGVWAVYTPEHEPTGEFFATATMQETNNGSIGCRLFNDGTGQPDTSVTVEMESSLQPKGEILILCHATNCIFNQKA